MRTVSSKKEFRQAVQDGETKILVTNKRLLKCLQVVAWFQSQNTIETITTSMVHKAAVASGAATNIIWITLIIASFVTIISLYAICKQYNVRIKVKKGPSGEKEGEFVIEKVKEPTN